MKMYLYGFKICISLLCLGTVGCTFVSEKPATLTTVAVPTATLISTETLHPTLTFTPKPDQVVLPRVTMSSQEAENALLKLLKTNGDCIGKCIAGIRPDEMTVQDAVDRMTQWGMVRIGENSQGKTFINLVQNPPDGQVIVNLSIGTWTKKLESIDKVTMSIHGDGSILEEDVWLANRDTWQGFRLDNLLKAYGMPSYIGYFFQTTVEVGSSLKGRTISYSMDMHYEELNLVLSIGAMAYYDGNDLFLCPSKDPHGLALEINPERPLIERKEFRPVTWQALTGTDLNVFYQTYTDENAFDACVTTNLEQIQVLQPSFR